MKGKSPEVCGKVHLLVRDFSKSMDDLPQVVNVVYDNFTSMSNAIDAAFRDIDTEHIFYDDISKVIQKVQQLNGIIRWALKWCVNDRGVMINRCFVDILMDIESYFTKASLFLTAAVQPSVSHTNDSNISPEFDYKSIQKAVLIFLEIHEPSSVSVFGEESVMERLDQATEDKNINQGHREHCIFLKKYIQFIKEHTDRASWGYVYTCVEYILDMMSCIVFHYKYTKTSFKAIDLINIYIHHLILCILVQTSSSRPPFTDEILVAYIECAQKILRWVPKISNHPIEKYQDALSLLHSIVSYAARHDIDGNVLFCIKVNVDTALRRLGHSVAWFFSGDFEGDIGSWHVEIFQLLLLPILHCDAFLSNEIQIKYAYYFRHYWFQLPKNEDIGMKSPLKDQSRFDEDLVFVARVVFYEWSEHHIDQEILINGRAEFGGVLRGLGCIISSSFNNDVAGNIAMAMNPGLPHLLTKVKNVKIQLAKTISPKIFKRLSLHNTETNLLGYLDFFFENLKEEISKCDLVRDWKHVLQTIQQDFVCFRSFLQNTRENSFKDDRLHNLSIRIRNAAYNAEYIINAFAAGVFHVSCRSFIISDFIEELNLIKEIIIEHSRDALPPDSVPANNAKIDAILPSSRASNPLTDVFVGLEAEKMRLMEFLGSNEKKLDVISIAGMPGIGKTTLAKEVYEECSKVVHFDFRAWCCVSQEYDKKELLLSILGTGVNYPEKSCQELSLMLHKELSGRRYLIVLDDVWDIDVFNEINRLFPKENCGSRIVVTSRIKLTGIQVELSPLSNFESWTILKQKVFPEKECPLELSQIGKQIANKCGGLPLAVVVVAGILAKSDMAQDAWEEVAARLDIYSADESERRMKALDLSYEVLPDHLKPLFLYVGAFPEDEIIPAKNLKWLWIAEGFIREETKTNKSLEDQAETYLMELIDRSLLMVAERKSDGSVRTCRIHDLMRDMSLGKAKAENFMQHHNIEGVENLSNQHLTYPRRVSASVIRKRYTQTPSTADEDPPVTCEDLSRLLMSSRLTSLMLFDPQLDDGRRDQFYKSIFQYHKMLRVFHAYGYIFGSIFAHVTLPVNLRYISVEYYMSARIFPSVFRLWNLETLIITTLPRESIEVPGEVWKMAKLRHLHIGNWAIFSSKTADSGKLENLQTLSTPVFIGNFPKVIGSFPNLRKLKCNFSDGGRDRAISRLPRLESLRYLESVKVLWNGRLPCSAAEFSLPITLRKLSLSWFRLKWKTISSFHKLPNLEILKLDFLAVEDEVWDMGDVEFPKLVFLELCDLRIKQWIASDKNFPRLHNLVLRYCDHLKEIPSDLGYICEEFEVNHCSHNASNSAKRIRDEQMENGNITVHISDPYPAREDSDSEYSDSE